MSFRYHVVSLVAIFLALTAGIALGGGPLAELGRAETAAPSAADAQALDAAEQQSAFADQVVAGSATRLYADGLGGRSVAILAFPGVPETTQEAVAAQVAAAGGTVAGTYAVEPALVAAGEKALVDTLGSQLMTQLEDGRVPAASTTYDRIGQLLGLAMATTSDKGSATSKDATSIRQSLAAADLVTTTGTPERRAPYVLALLGADTSAADDPIYAGVLGGLAAQSVGVVLAADTADGADGRLSRLREEPVAASLATVDGVETAAGQVTALLSLTEWPATRGQAYGASGADGAVSLR